MSSTIAVEEPRIGTRVQLERGWLSHPFLLSSLRIAIEDQRESLHALGLQGEDLHDLGVGALLNDIGKIALAARAVLAQHHEPGVYPAGSLLQLTDDRHATVGINSSRPLKPRVLVHDPRVPKSEALVLNLEHARDIGIRRSPTPAKMPSAGPDCLDPRPRVACYFEALATQVEPEEVPA